MIMCVCEFNIAFIYLFFLKYFLACYGFIDSTAEDITGNRGERRGMTRSKGTQAGSQTQGLLQSLSTWDQLS